MRAHAWVGASSYRFFICLAQNFNQNRRANHNNDDGASVRAIASANQKHFVHEWTLKPPQTEGLLALCASPSSVASLPSSNFVLIPSRSISTCVASGGDGGIRTLGTLLRFASLAKKYFRPLSHVSEA